MDMLLFPNIEILYEDDDIFAINKPSGIVVNRAHTVSESTIQDWVINTGKLSRVSCTLEEISNLKKEYPEVTEFGEPDEIFRARGGIAHRLDKETSGVLLIAKHPASLVHVLSQFKKRLTKKTYLALAHGKFQPEHGEIDLPIGRQTGNHAQFTVHENGKESVTQYHVLSYYPHIDAEKIIYTMKQQDLTFRDSLENGNPSVAKALAGKTKNFKKLTKIYQGFSLVELHPKTGRTHQIRVHLSHIHHPIVGDEMYSGKKRRSIDQYWCPRHFLHAKSIAFQYYRTKGEVKIEAPLTKDLQQSLEFLIS